MFGPLRRDLIMLLRQLPEPAWSAPTVRGEWTVQDVAAHLLGVELANVAARRDGVRSAPAAEQPLAEWLAGYNQQWVTACRRLSGRLLVEHLDLAAAAFDDYVQGLDIDQLGQPVSWAGPGPAPVWLDVAREYTERWTHQQQIREAVGSPRLDRLQARTVIATFVHALPVALASAPAADGTTVAFAVTGDGGGAWHLTRRSGRWHLRAGALPDPTARNTVRVSAEPSSEDGRWLWLWCEFLCSDPRPEKPAGEPDHAEHGPSSCGRGRRRCRAVVRWNGRLRRRPCRTSMTDTAAPGQRGSSASPSPNAIRTQPVATVSTLLIVGARRNSFAVLAKSA